MKTKMNPFRSILTVTGIFLLSLCLSVTGKAQNALDFDGVDDFVNASVASSLITGATELSITCWVYPENANPVFPDFDGFCGFRNDANADFYLVQLSPNGVEGRFRGSNGTDYTITLNDMTLNEWQHFALTYDGSTLKLYRNGILENYIAASGTISNAAVNFLIGNLVYSSNNFYTLGKIDEVSLWTKALTPQELHCIYTGQIDPASSGLKLYYKLDQGVAGGNNAGITNATDATGHITGVLNNFNLAGSTSNWVTGINAGTSITATICNGASYTWNGQTYTTAGTYAHVYQGSAGCDSIVNLILTVNTINTGISQSGITLLAVLAGATYQWVNCNTNYSHISGATNQSYTPTANGSYACIVTKDGCTDTTICRTITTVGIQESGFASGIQVYPVPGHDQVQFDLGTSYPQITLRLLSLTGQLLCVREYSDKQILSLDISQLESGIYLAEISCNGEKGMIRVMKE